MSSVSRVSFKVFGSPKDVADPLTSLIPSFKKRTMTVNFKDLPDGISLDPNPRDPNPERGKVYHRVRESAISDDTTFHNKNKGITIVADKTDYSPTTRLLTLYFRKGKDKRSSDGILDGGHTYKIIRDLFEEGYDIQNQYVNLTIYTGVPEDMIPALAEGLNNSTALPASTKMNHDNKFDWIKGVLKDQSYSDKIIYYQNAVGDIPIEDIISIMTSVNVDLFPFKGDQQPTIAYNFKGSCLDKYLENTQSYKKFSKILPDLLALYDYFSPSCVTAWNSKGGKAGALDIVTVSKKGYRFVFLGETHTKKLHKSVNLPLFSALRCFIKEKKGVFEFDRSVSEIKQIIDSAAPELIKEAREYYANVRSLNSLGRSAPFWSSAVKTMRLASI